MKWRHSLIYLAILVLIGGYFCYFEVVKKAEKEAAEKESKKVFAVQADGIAALEVMGRDKPPVQLKKDGDWKIISPVAADVENSSVESLVKTLGTLSWTMEVSQDAKELKPYGLEQPVTLKIRFQAAEQWFELLLGDKNPVGSGYYAKRGDKPTVFLLESSNWSVLNKGLDELRRRSLFTFRPEEVVGMTVAWDQGAAIQVTRAEGSDVWQALGKPELKVKSSKIQNMIEQVQWLRAQSFVENEVTNLGSHGLKPPLATLKFQLLGDRTAELTLGAQEKDDVKQIKALSSELPGIVQIDAGVLKDLPKDLMALEDRSLLGLKTKDVTDVKWNLGEARGHVVQTEPSKWELKTEDGTPSPLKEPWRVSSLLWDLQEIEYLRKIEPQPALLATPYGRLEVLNAGTPIATLMWEKPSPDGAGPAKVWVDRGGKVEAFELSVENLRKAEEDLGSLLQPEKAGS
jgi:hypothetical protein